MSVVFGGHLGPSRRLAHPRRCILLSRFQSVRASARTMTVAASRDEGSFQSSRGLDAHFMLALLTLCCSSQAWAEEAETAEPSVVPALDTLTPAAASEASVGPAMEPLAPVAAAGASVAPASDTLLPATGAQVGVVPAVETLPPMAAADANVVPAVETLPPVAAADANILPAIEVLPPVAAADASILPASEALPPVAAAQASVLPALDTLPPVAAAEADVVQAFETFPPVAAAVQSAGLAASPQPPMRTALADAASSLLQTLSVSTASDASSFAMPEPAPDAVDATNTATAPEPLSAPIVLDPASSVADSVTNVPDAAPPVPPQAASIVSIVTDAAQSVDTPALEPSPIAAATDAAAAAVDSASAMLDAAAQAAEASVAAADSTTIVIAALGIGALLGLASMLAQFIADAEEKRLVLQAMQRHEEMKGEGSLAAADDDFTVSLEDDDFYLDAERAAGSVTAASATQQNAPPPQEDLMMASFKPISTMRVEIPARSPSPSPPRAQPAPPDTYVDLAHEAIANGAAPQASGAVSAPAAGEDAATKKPEEKREPKRSLASGATPAAIKNGVPRGPSQSSYGSASNDEGGASNGNATGQRLDVSGSGTPADAAATAPAEDADASATAPSARPTSEVVADWEKVAYKLESPRISVRSAVTAAEARGTSVTDTELPDAERSDSSTDALEAAPASAQSVEDEVAKAESAPATKALAASPAGAQEVGDAAAEPSALLAKEADAFEAVAETVTDKAAEERIPPVKEAEASFPGVAEEGSSAEEPDLKQRLAEGIDISMNSAPSGDEGLEMAAARAVAAAEDSDTVEALSEARLFSEGSASSFAADESSSPVITGAVPQPEVAVQTPTDVERKGPQTEGVESEPAAASKPAADEPKKAVDEHAQQPATPRGTDALLSAVEEAVLGGGRVDDVATAASKVEPQQPAAAVLSTLGLAGDASAAASAVTAEDNVKPKGSDASATDSAVAAQGEVELKGSDDSATDSAVAAEAEAEPKGRDAFAAGVTVAAEENLRLPRSDAYAASSAVTADAEAQPKSSTAVDVNVDEKQPTTVAEAEMELPEPELKAAVSSSAFKAPAAASAAEESMPAKQPTPTASAKVKAEPVVSEDTEVARVQDLGEGALDEAPASDALLGAVEQMALGDSQLSKDEPVADALLDAVEQMPLGDAQLSKVLAATGDEGKRELASILQEAADEAGAADALLAASKQTSLGGSHVGDLLAAAVDAEAAEQAETSAADETLAEEGSAGVESSAGGVPDATAAPLTETLVAELLRTRDEDSAAVAGAAAAAPEPSAGAPPAAFADNFKAAAAGQKDAYGAVGTDDAWDTTWTNEGGEGGDEASAIDVVGSGPAEAPEDAQAAVERVLRAEGGEPPVSAVPMQDLVAAFEGLVAAAPEDSEDVEKLARMPVDDLVATLEEIVNTSGTEQASVATTPEAESSAKEVAPDAGKTAAVERKKQATSITLVYFTGWERPAIHASVLGGSWATYPMEKVSAGQAQWTIDVELIMHRVRSGRPVMEFVITDGQGNWDNPIDGSNYTIPSLGTFQLVDGNVTEL